MHQTFPKEYWNNFEIISLRFLLKSILMVSFFNSGFIINNISVLFMSLVIVWALHSYQRSFYFTRTREFLTNCCLTGLSGSFLHSWNFRVIIHLATLLSQSALTFLSTLFYLYVIQCRCFWSCYQLVKKSKISFCSGSREFDTKTF